MSYSPHAVTRRSLIARGLGLVGGLVGTRLAGEPPPHASAEKKQKKKYSKVQIAQRAQNEADMCAEIGGTAVTDARPGGVTVTCSHSDGSSRTCTFHSKGVRCSTAVMNPGTLPDLQTQHPWSDPVDTPDVPLGSTEPTLR